MIKNLTPHEVVVVDVATFPSMGIARAKQETVPAGRMADGIELVKTSFGEPVDLPEYEEGTWLIVSLATAQAAKAYGRRTDDLLVTCDPVRDDTGRIVGCRHLAVFGG